MSYYWARFEKRKIGILRFDTRVYLNTIKRPTANDRCIGAIVGKNPGSAIPSYYDNNDLQEIDLNNDQLLPNIRSIMIKAHKYSGKEIKANSYIQVLNLFYVCNRNLSEARKRIKNYPESIYCDTENHHFPFVWYVWGGNDNKLNPFKKRFLNIKSNNHFYLNTDTKEVVKNTPLLKDKARHTQGLKHDLVVPYLSKVLDISKYRNRYNL